jgi:hypothetical protein
MRSLTTLRFESVGVTLPLEQNSHYGLYCTGGDRGRGGWVCCAGGAHGLSRLVAPTINPASAWDLRGEVAQVDYERDSASGERQAGHRPPG